ncbi:MAG: diversity-generating retroelement protein Avd [Anaerolineae bacterium]|jgi:four helix bundle protein|nr:diversity-generating retroelement protein Avd [Anaerolineae bacterium]
MSQQSPIFVKTESFMTWLFKHTAKFPRHERFRLAKRIEDALFDFHAELVAATNTPKPKQHLIVADHQLNKLRAYLRLAVELEYTTVQQYQFSAEYTDEIGKLLGGWLKKF